MKFGRQKKVLVESYRYERLFVQAESNKRRGKRERERGGGGERE
jgi:hypothetical protein